MAVSIDNVYQRVLAISNKEQRGYVTPQEFNLLAYKAQMDIFESYFYNYGNKLLGPSVDASVVTSIEMLEEKLLPFKKAEKVTAVATQEVGSLAGVYYGVSGIKVTGINLPSDLYYLESIANNYMGVGSEVPWTEFYTMLSLSKLRPFSVLKPIFARGGFNGSAASTIFTMDETSGTNPPVNSGPKTMNARLAGCNLLIAPGSGTTEYGNSGITVGNEFVCQYVRKPVTPSWAYVVVGDKALYNGNQSVNFELHTSEESTITNKILELAGIVINKPGLAEVVLRNEGMKEAIKN